MKTRTLTIDILRGIAIFYMMVMHQAIHYIFKSDRTLIEPVVKSLSPLALILFAPLVLLSLWGPIFSLLTGFTVAQKMYSLRRTNPHQIKSYLKSRIVLALSLILVYRLVSVILYSEPFAQRTTPALLISLRFEADTLDTIGLTGVFIPLLLVLIWKPKKNIRPSNVLVQHQKASRDYWVLGLFFCVWLLVSPWIVSHLQALRPSLQGAGFYFGDFLLTKLAVGRFQAFPVLAYGILGALFGLAFARRESPKKIFGLSIVASLILIGLFILAVMTGFDVVSSVGLEELPLALHLLNLGVISFVFAFSLALNDYCSPEKQIIRRTRTKFFLRFSRASLTVYMTERFMGNQIFRIFRLLFGDSLDYSLASPTFLWSPVIILFYLFVNVIFWAVVLKLWEKYGYRYSIEWFLSKLQGRAARNSSSSTPTPSSSPSSINSLIYEKSSQIMEM